MALTIELVNAQGAKLGTATVTPAGKEWKKFNVSFTATATEPKAVLNIYTKGQGTIDLDMISLFPKDTYLIAFNNAANPSMLGSGFSRATRGNNPKPGLTNQYSGARPGHDEAR